MLLSCACLFLLIFSGEGDVEGLMVHDAAAAIKTRHGTLEPLWKDSVF